jgi:DNA-binding response OmpR family regulator
LAANGLFGDTKFAGALAVARTRMDWINRMRVLVARAGAQVRLERIPMDLLLLLVREGRRVVGREEIIERLWGKNVRLDTDNSIKTAGYFFYR